MAQKIFSKCSSILILLLIFVSLQTFAQKETANWYFGHKAGIKFPDHYSAPCVVTNSQMFAHEGSASISDSLGNLLFYTQGMTVFNKNHQVMDNGQGLSGGYSSTQAAIIIKAPATLNKYYIFTTDNQGLIYGLRYSIVDMNAMQGQGSIISKNNTLLTPVAEKLTAVDHGLTDATWLITHGHSAQNDAFYAYLITPNGIQPPVISHTGTTHQYFGPPIFFGNSVVIGNMKASPDGNRLALALHDSKLIEVFDFNNTTGVVSNPVSITNVNKPYGIEFSPDCKKLYASDLGNIIQYNLEAGNGITDSIISSKKILATWTTLCGSLQLAINGSIVVAMVADSALSVIADPNNLNSPNFLSRHIKLRQAGSDPGTKCSYGLPNFNVSYFNKPKISFTSGCEGEFFSFTLQDSLKYKSIIWNFGDPVSGQANTSTLFNPSHRFSSLGNYSVTVTATLPNGKKTTNELKVTIYPPLQINLGTEKEICAGEQTTLWNLAGTGLDTNRNYLWSTGAKTATISVSKPGVYWLEVSTPFNCPTRDSIIVKTKIKPVIFKEPAVEICNGNAFLLKTDLPENTKLVWSDGRTTPEIKIDRPGIYSVKAFINGCYFSDTIQVTVKHCPDNFTIPNLLTFNGDDKNEKFVIQGAIPGSCRLELYNRWGNLIYESENYNNDWPEKPPTEGVYYYKLVNKFTKSVYNGWLTIIR